MILSHKKGQNEMLLTEIEFKERIEKQKIERETSKNPPYKGWVTRVMSPATELSADMAIDSFRLMTYIREQMRDHDEQISVFIPNPFAVHKHLKKYTHVLKNKKH